ncbi:MAG: DsrE/DsrF/DrsH-like family protein [Mycobacterium sp.]
MWTGEGESKILYVQTHGVDDPGRSMYGPNLLQSDVVDKIGPKGDRGQPLSYFIDPATALGVRLLVCGSSLDLNDIALEDLIDGVEMIGAAAFNDLALEADAVVSF